MTRASLREYAALQRERYLRAPRAEKRHGIALTADAEKKYRAPDRP